MSETSEVPGQILSGTIRVPTKEEVSALAKMLSNKDRTVTIEKVDHPFLVINHHRLEKPYFPPGYLVNIYERDDDQGFHTLERASVEDALQSIMQHLGVDEPDLERVPYMDSNDRHSNPQPTADNGVYVGLGTMGRVCAAIEKQQKTRV